MRGIYIEMKKELEFPGKGDMHECLKLWRLYYTMLETVVEPPYLGFYKVFQGVRNCLWFVYGSKGAAFHRESKKMLK